MRFILGMILIIILSAATEYYLPWWMIAVVSFLVAVFSGLRPGKAFVMGFCSIALFWLVATLLHDVANTHILSARMAVVFHLPDYAMFLCVTVLIGALVGGLSAWAGALLQTNRGNLQRR